MFFSGLQKTGLTTIALQHIPPTIMSRSSSSHLSPIEQRDFQLIIDSAMQSGWIDPSRRVTADIFDDCVVITMEADDRKATLAYEHNERWLYRFLVDLAHGAWKSST